MINISSIVNNAASAFYRISAKEVSDNIANFDPDIFKNSSTKKTETKKTLPSYVKSSAVTNAEKAYNNWKNSIPTAPKDSYSAQINKLLNTISGRKFTYDHTTDPTYIARENEYKRQGRLAMEDTVGVASAKTGGYSNSYAVSAAGQAYNNYVAQIGDVIPELYEAAYNRYRDETEELYDRVELLSGLSDKEWERYGDVLASYYDEGKMLADELDRVSKLDYDFYKVLVSNS